MFFTDYVIDFTTPVHICFMKQTIFTEMIRSSNDQAF